MVNTNYSGSGFIGNKNITEDMAGQIGSKIAKFKETHGGTLTKEDVHDLIRTAASDDGKVSQQEMDWINGGLCSQDSVVGNMNISEAKIGEAVQFTFTLAKKDGSSPKDYKSEDIQKEAGKKINAKHKTLTTGQTVGEVGSVQEKKLSSLEKITQVMTTSRVSDNKCSASCIVAGVMYSKGREGLARLAETAQSYMNLDPVKYGDLISKLKDKSKPLTKNDIANLQDMVYDTLLRKQYSMNQANPSIHSQVVKDFISSPGMKDLMGKDLKVRNIDAKGEEGKTTHFVLFIGETGKNPAVYDSWPRKDNKQVVTDPKEVEIYRDAVSDS